MSKVGAWVVARGEGELTPAKARLPPCSNNFLGLVNIFDLPSLSSGSLLLPRRWSRLILYSRRKSLFSDGDVFLGITIFPLWFLS
jgi:hypothetical protein